MVKLVVLLENTKCSPNLECKHGLSVYAETERHKILFDMGPNDMFLKNAEKLGVDISEVDTAIISHGHVDHCGGLKAFLTHNKKAKIYLRPQAAEKHFVRVGIPVPIGINRSLISEDRFIFTDSLSRIDEEITLFSDVFGDFALPSSDKNLLAVKGGRIVADDFRHEQNLLNYIGRQPCFALRLCTCRDCKYRGMCKKYTRRRTDSRCRRFPSLRAYQKTLRMR